MIRVNLRNCFIIKIYNYIAMRFYYFGFQKFFIIDRLAFKFFFISALTLSQIVLYFLISHHFNQKIYPFCLFITTFYISVCFRKHYIEWLNFMIIIQVTNKVFIVFSPKKILLDTNTFSISTSLRWTGILLR